MLDRKNDSGSAGHAADTPVLMSWSGGKDSCIALYDAQRTQKYRVAALLTTVTCDYDRISCMACGACYSKSKLIA